MANLITNTDITKIQPMGDTTQYTLGARILTHTPDNTTTFLRGDNTWSNVLSNEFIIKRETETVNVTTNPAALYLQVQATDAQDEPTCQSMIACFQTPTPSTNHSNMVISSDGAMYIGSGNITLTQQAQNIANAENADLFLLADRTISALANTGSFQVQSHNNINLSTNSTIDLHPNSNTNFYVGNTQHYSISSTAIYPTSAGHTLGTTTIAQHFHKLYIGGSTTASNAIDSANPLIEFANTDRSQYGQLIYSDYDSVRAPDGLTWIGNQANSWFQAPRVFGAVWNDYAEYRETKENIQPGRCVVETGNGDLILSTERLQSGCEIVSDTFGFAIGETDKCKTPTACAGRVLAYLYEDNNLAKPGMPVCSGPNGTVSLMSHEEEKEWPSRIIGTISEIPNYEEWEYGSADINGNKNKLKVDGRVWIRIR